MTAELATWETRVVRRIHTRSRTTRTATVALVALALAACGSDRASQRTPDQVATDVGMNDGGEGCDVLSAAQVSAVLGAEVVDAVDVGDGCTFNYTGGSDYAATLQRMPASAYGPGGAKPTDYRELPAIGEAAWMGRGYQNSWQAQARSGDKAINVAVGGQSARPEVAIALLKAALPKA